MSDVKLIISCAGMINGEIVTVSGKGLGSVQRGNLGMDLAFSTIPPGFSIYCASLWTSCCSTPTFAIEQNGGINMLNLAKGRYRCERTFDFGPYGSYDYNYEIRLSGDEMQANGVIQGDVHLPEIKSVKESFTEMMIPVAPGEIRSFSATTFVAEDGSDIPVAVHGRYSPLAEDGADWTCCAKNQIRRSVIDILKVNGPELSLQYSTVIKGIDAPEFPRREALVGTA